MMIFELVLFAFFCTLCGFLAGFAIGHHWAVTR